MDEYDSKILICSYLCGNGTGPRPDTEIIIVGFSRGAAGARDFANMIYDQAVKRGEPIPQVQFLGLFDTVRMTAGLEQAIPPNVSYVAQAKSRNERRRGFPVTDLYLRYPDSNVICVTKEFYGCHSDAGGGNKANWISNAALLWMWAQMRKAGVMTVNRPGPNVTADFWRYVEYEETVFRWHEFLGEYEPSYSRPAPWNESATWWPWAVDRLLPVAQRHAVPD